MKINVEGISQGTRTIEEEYTGRQLGYQESGVEFINSIKIRAAVTRMGEDVYVDSSVLTRIQQECCRCLEGYDLDVDTRFQALFVPEKDVRSQKPDLRRRLNDDGKVTPYKGKVLNLSSDILNAVRMVLPMKPLCAEGCQGICQQCGTNLNELHCSCSMKRAPAGYNPFKELQGRF